MATKTAPTAPVAPDNVRRIGAQSPLGQTVLVLQGGGALGAYQAGVYQAMHAAGIEPDWIVGTSIGAINGAAVGVGATMQLPMDDKHSYNKDYLQAQLAILMGGRIAEEIFMHQITTGAGNDIERATDMARKMVCEWGMSELGPLSFGKREEQIFLGREIAQHRDYSEDTAIRIDEQVKKFVDQGYQRAHKLIVDHSDAMHRIAKALVEREVLDGAEVKKLIEGEAQLADVNPPKSEPPTDGTQVVLKPEPGIRIPGMLEGGPQPA